MARETMRNNSSFHTNRTAVFSVCERRLCTSLATASLTYIEMQLFGCCGDLNRASPAEGKQPMFALPRRTQSIAQQSGKEVP